MASRSYTVNGRTFNKVKSTMSSLDIPSSSQPVKKRKHDHVYSKAEDEDEDDFGAPPKKKGAAGRKKDEEKRLRVFRKKPPKTFLDRLDRVRTQRMFLIDRNRSMSADGKHEEEVFEVAGTTGNIYQITISKEPRCSCPDSAKGNQCKHIVYVLVNILKAPEDLSYQLAFLTSELAEIFAKAPATPQSSTQADATSTDTGGHRKQIEGDCPVCVMEFEEGDDIVWCKAACGNNVHRQCFEQWAKSKPGQVKCVYCRTPWKGDEASIQRIAKGQGKVNGEGYVNVASELGLSGHRDMSSYHQFWVRRQFGRHDHDYDGY